METKDLLNLAEDIVAGSRIDLSAAKELAAIPDKEFFKMLPGAELIRRHFFGMEIHLCTICNAKSGKCSEDCAFCSQSAFAHTDAPVYPLLSREEMKKGSRAAQEGLVNRYSIVTSGKRLKRSDVEAVANAISDMAGDGIYCCASLGTLDREDLEILKQAGLSRYHHNLETSRSFYNNICTTHSYDERLNTVLAAKEVGLSVCSGGLFGMGETYQQILELAFELRKLDADAVPVNFLTPIKGTKLENTRELTPLRCLKIIAMLRYVLPEKEIIVCGGREANLRELHALVFYAGASGIMTGNYLTTQGRTFEQDLNLLKDLGLTKRAR